MLAIHWASKELDLLKNGSEVELLASYQDQFPVKLKPGKDYKKGDIILTSLGQNIYLFTVFMVEDSRVQVLNQKGRAMGYVNKKDIHGHCSL